MTHARGDELTHSGADESGPAGVVEPMLKMDKTSLNVATGEWFVEPNTPEELAAFAEGRKRLDAQMRKRQEAEDMLARLADVRDRWDTAKQEEKDAAMLDAIKMVTRKIPAKGQP